ncbi:MAG: glycosyltransferase family 4 protein [Lachnospiraceae bacterium]
MKHIILISNSFGSLYNFRKELILQLLLQYKVTLLTPMNESDYSLYEELKEKGCQLVETPMQRRGKNPFQELQIKKLYCHILRQQKPDLVLTYTIKPNAYGAMACQKLGIPYMGTVTGLGYAFEKEGFLQKVCCTLLRKGFSKAEAVFFQNESSREFLINRGAIRDKEKLRLVPGSGINLEHFAIKPYPEQETFLYMARIMKAKGAEEFFTAMEKMKEKYPDVLFDVVGFCEEAYEEKLKALETKGYLRYYGWRNDPETFLEAASCLVNPTYHEGMSNVCLEAAATGRPILASDIPGCAETLEDGKTGFSFPPKDAKALYDAMEKFHLLTRDEKEEMGKCGRAKMEREFDRKIVMKIYLEEIHRVLGDQPPEGKPQVPEE